MSASFPQMAFWAIFPLAGLIVLSGWVLILISAAQKLRARKLSEENGSLAAPSRDDPTFQRSEWIPEDEIISESMPMVPLH